MGRKNELNTQELNVVPGSIVHVRDENWVFTATEPSVEGTLVRVQRLTEPVRDTIAASYLALDHIDVVNPRNSEVVAGESLGYRKARLFLETALRKTQAPQFDEHRERLAKRGKISRSCNRYRKILNGFWASTMLTSSMRLMIE